MNELVLAVDGGGTKTVACVARLHRGHPLEQGRGSAGSSNLVAVGERSALDELDRAVRQACEQADCRLDQVTRSCLALAGSDRPSVQQRIEQWSQQNGLGGQLRIVHDAEPVLAAGTQAGWGIALIGGTGSFAFSRNQQGVVARAGGWGPLLGDEGGGYRLALSALQAVTRQLDGRGPATELTACLLDQLRVSRPHDLPARVADQDRRQLAALAPLVLDLAEKHDPVAVDLAQQAADALADLVRCLAGRMDWGEDEFPLALSGGLLLNRPQLVSLLQEHLKRQRAAPSTLQLVSDPVQGALLLASR